MLVAPVLTLSAQPAPYQLRVVQASDGSRCDPFGDPSELGWECDDGSGYIFDFDASTVSLYNPANPDAGITDGPIHMVSMGAVSGGWTDANGCTCSYRLADPYFNNKQVYVTCQG
jgi:hypothetical protein